MMGLWWGKQAQASVSHLVWGSSQQVRDLMRPRRFKELLFVVDQRSFHVPVDDLLP
eukprot:COSAG06_NODE_5303_length_3575_cov_2.292290_1_plen_55_part_10